MFNYFFNNLVSFQTDDGEHITESDMSPVDKDKEKEGDKKKETSKKLTKTDDLFSAHDFDIKIDLEVPLHSKLLLQNAIFFVS